MRDRRKRKKRKEKGGRKTPDGIEGASKGVSPAAAIRTRRGGACGNVGQSGRTRSLKRPEKRELFNQGICCPPSPNQLNFSDASRQAPSFAGVDSVPKWAVPFLRLGAELARTGCSGPGVVLGSSRQFVTSFSFHVFTAKRW